MCEARCHGRIDACDSHQEKEQKQRVIESEYPQRADLESTGYRVHPNPQVGRRHAKSSEVTRLPVQRKSMHQQGREQDHPRDTALSQNRPSRRGDGQ